MFRKSVFTYFLSVAAMMLLASAVFAQSSPVSGVIKMQKADGTLVPVADAVVEAYRTDIGRGKMPSAKTNKRGEFTFAGFPVGQKFVLAVSGTGIGPRIQPNVSAGMDNVQIVVTEGDGRVLTEEEARQAALTAGATAAGELSGDQKKELAEIERKNAEIAARNQKIQEGDTIARRSVEEGNAAYQAKNYDLALAKFDEGIAAVPDFVGSTPVLLNGKLLSLKERGYKHYVDGAAIRGDLAARRAKYELAKKEYSDAIAAYNQAMEVYKKAAPPEDEKDKANRRAVMSNLYTNVIEVHRLMAVAQVDTSRASEAESVINEYAAFETDPAKKTNALVVLGDIFRSAGDFENAIATYRKVLEAAPDNTTVMASLGLSLVGQASADDPPDRAMLQEGLNFMQKYADTAQIQESDSAALKEFKQSVKDTVEYLKTDQKLKPQAPARRKN